MKSFWSGFVNHLGMIAATAAAFLIGLVATAIRERLERLIDEADPTMLLAMIVLCLIVALLSLALYLFHRPRLRFREKYGCWQDKKNGYMYCAECRSKRIFSPMKHEEHAWRCMVCSEYYPDPDNPMPRRPRVGVG